MSMKQLSSLTTSQMANCIDFAAVLPLVLVMLLQAEAVTRPVILSEADVVALQPEDLQPRAVEVAFLPVLSEGEEWPRPEVRDQILCLHLGMRFSSFILVE